MVGHAFDDHRRTVCVYSVQNRSQITVSALVWTGFLQERAPLRGRKDKVQKNTGQGRTAASDDRSEPA